MKDQQTGSERYVLISSDCHAGADWRDEIPEDPNFGFIIESYLGMSNIVGPKKG